MPIPARIALPVLTAVLLAGGIIVTLFLQLEGTRAMLVSQLLQEPAAGTGTEITHQVTNLLSIDENGALLHLRRGDIFTLRGEWKQAEQEYAQAVEKDGGLPALRKLVQAQIQRRDIRGARETIDQLRRSNAAAEDLVLLESMIAMRTGELSVARRLLEGANVSPQQQYGLGLLSLISGNHEAARTALHETAAGWEPVLRAHARELLAAYDEYAQFPDSPEIHMQTLLSRALADAGECELALPLLFRVTREQDDYRDAWIVQGFCELTTERYGEALASLEQAYRIDPRKPEIQYFLARAYGALEDHANALTFLQYALQNGFQPESEVRRMLASEATTFGNTDLALEQYAALTTLSDATVDTYRAFISAALAANRAQEAVLKAEEALTKWPDDLTVQELVRLTQEAIVPQDV